MRAVGIVVRLTRKRNFTSAAGAARLLARDKATSAPPDSLKSKHAVTCRQIEGFDCWTVAPRTGAAGRAAIYLHGGAYANEISPQHWALVDQLASAGVHVEVPIYGLAPQHTYREAYPFLTAVHRELVGSFPGEAVTVAGDSAGGGLALGFAQTLLTSGLPQPGHILLISPWLDLTLSNPDLPAAEAQDPWLGSAGSREIGRVWAGGDDPADPRLSPLNGPLVGLAPLDVYIGTRDMLYPDVRLLSQRAEQDHARVTLTVCNGGLHVYPLTPTPEGRAASAAIVRQMSA